jgi:hypothetical protein
MEELKPCPFCGDSFDVKVYILKKILFEDDEEFQEFYGEKPKGRHTYRVICSNCEVWGQPRFNSESAIRAWNKRT